VEDTHVGSRKDAIAAWITTAASAVVGGIHQYLEYRNIGQACSALGYLLGRPQRRVAALAGLGRDAISIGLGPGRAEVDRFIDVSNQRIGGKA
jgi:hypothetical protein